MYFWGSFLKPLFPHLLKYNCEEQVKRTKGFVLQVQQGVSHEKSHMQVAEERQSAWLIVPRIAVFAFENNRHRIGGGNLAKESMETALAQAEEQWRNGIEAALQMCSERYEPVDGADKVPTDSRGEVHGMAKCTFPSGDVYVGEWQHGDQHGHGTYTWPDGAVYIGQFQHNKRHGHGTYTWADGRVYVGEWQHDKMHGKGKYTYPNRNFELGFYVADKDSGEAVRFSKDGRKAWLLKDGEIVRELSQTEAAKKVEELGLSELLIWVLDPIWKDFGRRKVPKSCQMLYYLLSCQRSELRVVLFWPQNQLELGLNIIVLSCSVCHVSIFKNKISQEHHKMKWNGFRVSSQRSFEIQYHSSHNHGSEKWWFFKGNYYWRDPFFTSMITGDRVTTC